MDKSIITFSANEQNLQKTGGIGCYASDTVSYIEAHFDLGENWSGYDSIRAVWFNDYKTISTVLDSDGVCVVPHEVLTNRGKVMVNLVGSVLVSGELSDRLTTFPCEALKVSAKAKISGSETAEVTPSQFEQFVSIVISEVEEVTGMTAQAETLPAGSQATARYEDGILYLGIPQGIRGERGETGADGADGNGIASVVYNADYSLTLIFDNGERFTTPPIRGERGPAGADGRDGTDGADGVTPNISIGNVTTLEPSEDAYVTRRGTDANPIFDFGIPKGNTGTVPDLDLILPTDTASGDIASITDGQSVVPVKSLKVTLEPIQSGSGTPSPDNVRPISGHTEVVTIVSPTTDAEDGTSYTTDLGRTVYGGTLDVVSGELVVDRAYITIDPSVITASWFGQDTDKNTLGFYTSVMGRWTYPQPSSTPSDVYEEYVKGICYNVDTPYLANILIVNGNFNRFEIRLPKSVLADISTSAKAIESVQAYLTDHPLQMCYRIATPQTYQLTPQTISLLHGNNNVWSDGSVVMVYNADVGLYIDKKLGTSGTRTLSMTRTLAKPEDTDDTKSEETETKSELTKSDNIQLAED